MWLNIRSQRRRNAMAGQKLRQCWHDLPRFEYSTTASGAMSAPRWSQNAIPLLPVDGESDMAGIDLGTGLLQSRNERAPEAFGRGDRPGLLAALTREPVVPTAEFNGKEFSLSYA